MQTPMGGVGVAVGAVVLSVVEVVVDFMVNQPLTPPLPLPNNSRRSLNIPIQLIPLGIRITYQMQHPIQAGISF